MNESVAVALSPMETGTTSKDWEKKKTGHMNMFQSVQSTTSNHSILKKMVVRKQKNS